MPEEIAELFGCQLMEWRYDPARLCREIRYTANDRTYRCGITDEQWIATPDEQKRELFWYVMRRAAMIVGLKAPDLAACRALDHLVPPELGGPTPTKEDT